MAWQAVVAVDSAVETVRRFLFPVRVVRWTKLAIIVIFVGGLGGPTLPPVPGELRGRPSIRSPFDWPIAGGSATSFELLGIPVTLETFAAVAVAVVVALAVISRAFEFVLYDALRTDEVLLWEPLRRRFLQAVRLFAFELGVIAIAAAPVAAVAWAVETGRVAPGVVDSLGPAGLAGIGLIAGIWFAAAVLVLRFTDEFVMPVMVRYDEAVIPGWRRLWPAIRSEWLEFLSYLLVHFFLLIAIAIVQAVVVLLVGGIVLALGALVGLVLAGALGGIDAALASTVGLAALGALGIVVAVTLAVVLLPIRVLVVTYVRAYEVSTLGGIDSDLRLLAPGLRPERPDPPSEASGAGEN